MSWYSIRHPFELPRAGRTHRMKLVSKNVGYLRKVAKKAIRTLRRNLFLSTEEPVLRDAFTRRRGTLLLSQEMILMSRELPRVDNVLGGISGTTRSLCRTTRKHPANCMIGYSAIVCLPLARRLFNTKRPFFVFMRVKKPCVLARRRLLGWNVRFITKSFQVSLARRANLRFYLTVAYFSNKKTEHMLM